MTYCVPSPRSIMSSKSSHEAFPPGPPGGIDVPAPFPSIEGERIARKLERLDLPSLVDDFEDILWKSDVQFRNIIEVDPRTLPDASITEPVATRQIASANFLGKTQLRTATIIRKDGDDKDLSTILLEQRAAVIGGAIVRNISLLVGEEKEGKVRFGDLPVLPLQVPEGEKAKLFSSEETVPILILPEEYTAPPGFEHVEGLSTRKPGKNGSISDSEVGEGVDEIGMRMTDLNMYTVSGDIVDFWGIKGLTAKLYKYKGKVYDYIYSSPSVDSKNRRGRWRGKHK